MNARREPWKDVLHVEIHVPGFDLQRAIRRARKLKAQKSAKPSAGASPVATTDPPASDPECPVVAPKVSNSSGEPQTTRDFGFDL